MSNRRVRHQFDSVAYILAACATKVIIALVIACLAMIPRNGCAAEPARQFLNALADRGYYDTSLEYLDWLESTGTAPAEFRDAIRFEQGSVLLTAAQYQHDPKLRERDLGKAQELFTAFLASHASHSRAVDAQSGLRQIRVELARNLVNKSTMPAVDSGKLLAQAQSLFDEVAKSYEQRIEQVRQELEGSTSGGSKDDRQTLRAEYLQAKLMSATVAYEAAATEKANPDQYAKRLEAADKQFAELAKKYRKWLAGILAVYYRGQIQQDLGNLEDALTYYEEHTGEMNQPPALRNVAAKATSNAIQCWIDPKLKQYDQAIEVGEKWIAAARPEDNSRPEWLALRMMLARAYRVKADTADGDAGKSNASALLINARNTAEFVARFPGTTQPEARKFIAELGGPAKKDPANVDFSTFDDARTTAVESRQEIANSDTVIRLQESKLASLEDPAGRKEARSLLEATQNSRNQQVEQASQLHRMALQLARADTPIEQVNDLRYYYCYLLYSGGRHYEAAVLGDFIARHFPDAPGARTAANIALASYATIQNEMGQNETEQNDASQTAPMNSTSDFVAQRLEELADHIVRTWPGQKEADEALITLVSFMVRDGRFDQAEQYLNKIPADSPRRGAAELRTGQALWTHYVRTTAENSDRADNPLKQRAQSMLQDGIERMKQSPPTETLVRAVLSLSQIYLDTNEPAAAITLLEDPQVGPKTLADSNSPLVTSTTGLTELIYRVALRAYIDSSSMGKVTETMAALGNSVNDSPAGRRRLIGIYMGLAKDLSAQIEMAKPADRKSMSASFDKFLTHISSNTQDFSILNWVAETYSGMGDAIDSDSDTLSADAKRFYERAASGYSQILDLHQQGSIELDKNMVSTVRMRLASTQRRLGNYQDAVTTFADILAENNMMLNVQVEAARALQAGAAAGQTEWYTRAVMGDPRSKATGIWGWGKLSKIVAAQMYKGDEEKQRYGDTFYESRLQMAQCQYDLAKLASGDKKAKYLANAAKVLTSTVSLYPDLGGPKWKSDYDKLLKEIQSILGEPATGLDALQN